MKKNMGSIDRAVRLLVAVLIAGLYFTSQISGATATLLLIIAGIFAITGVSGFCPLYLPFGFSTRKKTSKNEA